MDCIHFGSCGSCSLYDRDYVTQIELKDERVRSLIAPFYRDDLKIFTSPQDHYRARAEFRIWHEGESCSYAMGALGRKGAVTIDECPKVIYSIENRMWKLLDIIKKSPLLKTRLFAVEFLATTADEVLITMLYHKKLDTSWEEEAKQIESALECKVLGRSRKQKVILSDEFVREKLHIDGRDTLYREYESGFTQPNPIVNIAMIEWAISHIKDIKDGDFLESYCGLGNFTIPISYYFEKILATEISKRSIYAAQENCIENAVDNISFVRLSSEEMTQALNKEREFNRLQDIDLDSYDFSTVLVDPPRAGLDEGTIKLIATLDNILYISCNPETLARDLDILSQTHQVKDVAIFDQFPHTPHIESGVYLQRHTK